MPAASDLSGHGARAAASLGSPSRTTVLTPLHSSPLPPQKKTASLEVNKCPAGWVVFGNCQEFYWLMG